MVRLCFYVLWAQGMVLGLEAELVRGVIRPHVERHYPSRANHERMSLYDLIAFAVLAHRHFEGVYERVYCVLIVELLFSAVRYNKVVGRFHRV